MWKDVIGYEGLYKISDDGELFSVRSNRKLNPTIGADGYRKIVLSVNNERRTVRINRLVADAFVENPFELPIVNHKDGDKLNNSSSNLEWVTPLGNALHASKTGLLKGHRGESNPMCKLTEEQVDEIKRTYKKRSHDANARILGERFGVSDSTIWLIASGQIWK